ncbi:heat-shock protein [Aureimonas endophytica]|uniref:Heat-shock protein n=1 Tax=Aureimonas endophytica TaxID=2027858 RepID=A0A917A1W4_9HYPH|nr:Hsp70 family protein [Aureimonas endophytica]GGE21484.1 heat-shock protein [Aureimonas endophytica]
MSALHAGLDFGTTNSTLGLCGAAGAPRLLALEGEHRTIPSALFFSLEDGRTYFGRAAVHEYVDGAEGRFMRALKSILGTKLMGETTLVGRERLSFEALIGRFLAHLKGQLDAAAGAPVERAVFGRPVRFVDEDDAADRRAEGELASAARAQGFSHVEFQFEPVAAALYHESTITEERLALVVDIGGGTSDFTVVRLSPERAKRLDRRDDLLASTGVHVGGTDFDRLLNIAKMQPLLGLGSESADGKRRMPVWYFNDLATWHRVNLLYTPKIVRDAEDMVREAAEPEKLKRLVHVLRHRSGHRIAGAVEAAKIRLTDEPETAIRLAEPELTLEAPVARAEFEAAVAELVERIGGAIEAALETAGVAAEAIETVILTGGGAQVPAVFQAATGRFPGAEIARSDAFGSVGLGLAIDAARRFR